MADRDDQVQLTVNCLCKTHTFHSTISRHLLPLKSTFCHCNSCRYVTGGLYTSCIVWPGSGKDIARSSLKKYKFSENFQVLFCSKCSSPLFWEIGEEERQPHTFKAFTGALVNHPIHGMIQFTHHIFVGDTVDGGASMWLRKPNVHGTITTRWAGRQGESDEIPPEWPAADGLPDAAAKPGPDSISIRCHCRGVEFVVRRGDTDYARRSKGQLPWFVDPTTYKSWGGFDGCDSCRLSSGADVFNWTFALLEHVDFHHEYDRLDRGGSGSAAAPFFCDVSGFRAAVSAKDRDPRFGTLASYQSSTNVQRHFCSRCSACVFLTSNERPDMINIAVGLLVSPDGARAENMISWAFGGNRQWLKDMLGGWREDLLDSVEAETEAWRVERGYPKHWYRLQMEKAHDGTAPPGLL